MKKNNHKTKQYVVSGDKEHPLDISDAIKDSLGYVKTVQEVYINQFGSGRAASHILMTGGTSNPLYEYLTEVFNHHSIHLAGNREKIYMANVRGGMVIIVDQLITESLLPPQFKDLG